MSARVSFAPALLALVLVLFASSALGQSPGPCGTPREAVAHFLDNLQPELYRPEEAIRCFDWSAGPASATERRVRARELQAVLDGAGKYVVYADVPGDADYKDPGSGLARVVLFPSMPEVYLEKSGGEWKISAATVALVPDLHGRMYRLPLQRWAKRLPPAFDRSIFGTALWQLLALALLVGLGLLFGSVLERALTELVRRTVRRFFENWDPDIERRLLRWGGRFGGAVLIGVLLPNLGLSVRLNQALLILVQVAAAVAAVMAAHALVDLVSDALTRRARDTETSLDDALLPLLRKLVKAVLDLAGALFLLQNLDVDIGSLLATLGLGGLAVALAAQKTLGNFFGFVTILADRPFQIGDWVTVGTTEGTVEEVGIRSTRIRTFYDSVVTIPNGQVADSVIDNLGIRRYRRFKTVLGLEMSASSTQIEAFVQGVRESILTNSRTRKDAFEVHFNGLSESAYDVLVYCFFDVPNWTEELTGKQELLLAWLALAEDLGVAFAYPTRTIELAAPPEALPAAG